MSADTWLVVCDIDGTLLLPEAGNPGLDELNAFLAARRDTIVFALDSGRSLGDIAAVSEFGPIARPDWIMSDVGTALFSGFTPDTEDAEWSRVMAQDWGREDIRAVLADCPGLVEQEAWHQHPAKLSYYFNPPGLAALPEVRRRASPWLDRSKLIVTQDYFLDLMPTWGGKGAPILHLAARLGIPLERIIVAGDSGNDRDMLTRGFRSIVVANRAFELDDLAGTPGVYFARQKAAAGVLEGLLSFYDWPLT